MFTLLLVLIYTAFISLGLPDSILGAAWPTMQTSLHVPTGWGGILSFLITCGTIVSSLFSGRLMRHFSTGTLVLCSVACTAIALFGFSCSTQYWQLCIWTIPYGLGAGAVDAVLNHFVALHCNARHMSWLHCFWGIGATAGPLIMGACLSHGMFWQSGYRIIAYLQFGLTCILLFSLPLWRKHTPRNTEQNTEQVMSLRHLIQISGVPTLLLAFFFYSALELTTGLWGSSYMTQMRGISPDIAANWIALFYLGITVGRFISGFLTLRFSDDAMVQIGEVVALLGVLLICLPLPHIFLCMGLIATGLGCAPIYPSLIHATPYTFGTKTAQSLIGLQMAVSYLGSTCMPPFSGFLAQTFSMGLYPFLLLVFVVCLSIMTHYSKKQRNPIPTNTNLSD